MGHKKKKEAVIPKGWQKRCNKDTAEDMRWCALWIDSLSMPQKVKLNCGKSLQYIDEERRKMVEGICKGDIPGMGYPTDRQRQLDCIKWRIFIRELNAYPCNRPRQRSALLGTEKSGSSLVAWLSVGAILLIILGIILAYWYFFGGQKSDRPPKDSAKGTGKTSKSKLGKSRIGSRKSSKRRSRKDSQRSKAIKSAKGNKSAKMK